MPQKIRMWEVTTQNTLNEISSSEITLEERLEDWLESDISMLGPDLIVVGRQVRTDFGGEIDLLCLESSGDTVVVELKKGRTPREVTAQALDYASWIRGLPSERIYEIAGGYAKINGSLEDAYYERFGEMLPETLNQNHRSLIVAGEMDDSTERIVRYLAEMKVPVNVVTVQHFKSLDRKEMLAQVFLVPPEAEGAKSTSRYNLGTAQAQAYDAGVGHLYGHLHEHARGMLRAYPYSGRVFYQTTIDERNSTVVIVWPPDSDATKGLSFSVPGNRVMRYLGITEDQLTESLPVDSPRAEGRPWSGAGPEERENWFTLTGYFRAPEEIDRFLDLLKQ